MKRTIVIIALVLILLIGVAGLAAARDTAPPPQTVECQVNQTCHLLLYPGSRVYILTADGRVDMQIYGHDSLLIENVSNTR